MPILLFRLNRVPEDEADDIRGLLSANHIDFYETEAGRWGISLAGIWLKDDSQLETAQRLIDDYQRERTARARELHEARRQAGEHETLLGRLMRHPLLSLLYILAILVVLYFTLAPFLRWG
jgi:hypothetical protein